MAKGRQIRVRDWPWAVWLPPLMVLSVCFFLGSVAGCLAAGSVGEEEQGAQLAAYVEGYLSAARQGMLETPGLLSVLWEQLRWPGLAFLLSLTAVGLIGLPVLFVLRGFLLSFAVASFVRVLGGAGSILAFVIFGVTGILSVPALFVLGTQGMLACRVLLMRLCGEHRRGSRAYEKGYFSRCGVCAAVIVLCAFLEQMVLPSVLRILAGTF